MSIAHVRTAFQRWHAAASAGLDLIDAVTSITAPDCVVHLQNGESGPRENAQAQLTQARALYPDLSLEIEHGITGEDRLLVQLTTSGTPSLVFRNARGPRLFLANGAVIARINDRAEIAEMWPYTNPGAMLVFPPRSHPPVPPLADSVPGTEENANAVARQWMRATTGPEFLERILASALPECIVHATNSDVGSTTLVEEHFQIIQSAFADLTVSFEPGFVVGDRLIMQFTFDGTQRGWLGIAPPSGSRVQSTGAIVARVTNNERVQEMWVYLAPGIGLIFRRRDR